MPDRWETRPIQRDRCRTVASPFRKGDRRVPWSTSRGDCRFDRGHDGPCKPGRRR